MAKLDGLSRYFDPGLILADVPGADGVEREYVIPLPSAELGLWCQHIAQVAGRLDAATTEEEAQAAVERVNALPELDGDLTLAERTLGAAYGQMMADGVSHPHIQFCGAVAYVWIVGGDEAAERYWRSGGRPEPSARGNRASRRAAAKTSTGGPSGGAANATPTPASTSGTTSRPKNARRRGSRSPGRTS